MLFHKKSLSLQPLKETAVFWKSQLTTNYGTFEVPQNKIIMAVRIRLQRFGKKNAPFYHIVAADSRAPRDGKFIERLGTYDPMTNPATVELDVDKAVKWMRNGAQPSDTARSLLSTKGAMLKHHLLRGVDKGALTVEQAQVKFEAWVADKEAKIQKVVSDKDIKAREENKSRLAAEAKVREVIAAKVAKKKTAELTGAAEEAPAAEVSAEPVAETVVEVVAEPVAEVVAEPVAETVVEPVAEVVAEPVAETTTEPVAETTAEPVAEVVAEPVVEAATEPVAEVVAEPVAEVVAEPAVEAADPEVAVKE
jgi:small subunit ribosomal protein S16